MTSAESAAAEPGTSAAGDAGFHRSLGLYDSTMIVVGGMIGSGIFLVSADMARLLGSAPWLLVAWGITALLTLSAALSEQRDTLGGWRHRGALHVDEDDLAGLERGEVCGALGCCGADDVVAVGGELVADGVLDAPALAGGVHSGFPSRP